MKTSLLLVSLIALFVVAAQCVAMPLDPQNLQPSSPGQVVVPLPTNRPSLEGAQATSITNEAYIRRGPGTAYPLVGLLRAGQSVDVTGVSPDGGWWQVRFAGIDSERGWVAKQLVTVENINNIPVVYPDALMPAPVVASNIPEVRATTTLNVRSGPGIAYPVLGRLANGQSAELIGVSPDRFWWQIVFADSDTGLGWVSAQFVTAQNTTDVPLVQAPALPVQPPPAVISEWLGEYYNNPTLSGAPNLVRNDVELNFNWGEGRPANEINADRFSARWSRVLQFTGGTYRFYVNADDGVRLWVDNNLVLDQWHEFVPTTYVVDVGLVDGPHTIKLEYFENAGAAVVQLRWDRLENFAQWKGEYFNNPGLTGAPVVVRNDQAVQFSWGGGAPADGIASDNFSARWTRNVEFSAGIYRFNVLVDDGARLWVDGALLIDQWRTGEPKSYSAEIYLSDGTHNIRLEYFDFRFDAQVQLRWEKGESFAQWKAEYYGNRRLNDKPILTRSEGQIKHDWGGGSPAGVPSDGFSARWTRRADFAAGQYRFWAKADDGIRVWVDGDLKIESWKDGRFRLSEATVDLSQGEHEIRVEYYENSGDAAVEFDWQKLN